jgi:hypothetical protein
MTSNSEQYLNRSSLAASFGEVRSFVTKKKTNKKSNPLKETDLAKDINPLKETDPSKDIVNNANCDDANCDDQYKFKDRRKIKSVNSMKFEYEEDEFPSLGQKSETPKQSVSKCWSPNDVTTIRNSCDTGVLPTVKLPPLYTKKSNTKKSINSPTFPYNYNVEEEEEFDDEDDDYEGEQDEEDAINRYYDNEHNANIGSTKYDAQR